MESSDRPPYTSPRDQGATMTSLAKVLSQPANKHGYLMTPEEQTAHSFSQDNHEESFPPKLAPLQGHGLQSPPTSPTTQSLPNLASATGFQPPLSPQYNDQNNYQSGFGAVSSSAHPAPRFGDAALFPAEAERAQAQAPLFELSPPRAVRPSLPSIVGFSRHITTPQQAEDFWRSGIADVQKMQRVRLPDPTKVIITSARDPISVSQLRTLDRAATKPRTPLPRANKVVKPTSPAHKQAAASTTARRASRQKATTAMAAAVAADGSPTPMPTTPATTSSTHIVRRTPDTDNTPKTGTKHRRAPASKPRPTGESWNDIADFCPPTSSLDDGRAPKPLRARSVGSSGPLDLSKDPDKQYLHADELVVCSTLRLPCAKYLLNKRKIFKAKVEHLRAQQAGGASGGGNGGVANGSGSTGNFNKTEAQKACTIDVNKASALFQAFEEVGWLRKEWFQQFL